MRGLLRISNYYNRLEARNDWNKFEALVNRFGLGHLIAELKPSDESGWRKIDKAIKAAKSIRVNFSECPTCHSRPYMAWLSEICDEAVDGCSACEYCETIQYPTERKMPLCTAYHPIYGLALCDKNLGHIGQHSAVIGYQYGHLSTRHEWGEEEIKS